MVDSTRRRDRDDEDRGSRGRDSSRDEPRGRGRDDDRGERSERRSPARDDDRGGGRGRGDRDEDRGGRSSSGSGKDYVYQTRSAEDVRERASKGANDYDKILKPSIKMWKPNDGDNRIRVLPPTWHGAKHFGYDIYVHYGVGPDRGSYLCLQKMKQEADPIAEEREVARRDGDEKYAKELDAKRRVLVYIIDRDHPKEGVQAWAMPWTVDRDIVKVSVDKQNGQVLPIDDPENGYDVEFEKKGSKDRTEYLAVSVARRSSALGNDEWLDFAMDNPLPEQLQFYDYDHIAKAFHGAGAQRDTRGSRDEGRGDDRDAPRERDRDRDDRTERRSGRDEPPARGRAEPPPLSWESVHEMTAAELDDLIEQEKLDIDPREAKDDADLADWICDELKLKKTEARAERRSSSRDDDRDAPAVDRLRRMRADRGD